MKVFVTQEPLIRNPNGSFSSKYDMSGLREFGDVVFCIHGRLNDPDMIQATLEEALYGFDEKDYLCPAGDPVIIAAAVFVLFQKGLKTLNFLLWDKRFGGKYIPLTLHF